MLKGCRRNMVMVRGDRESVYEMALFLLKSNAAEGELHDTDMLSEAERILRDCTTPPRRARRRLIGTALFLLGIGAGAGLFLLLSLLL